VVKCRRLIPVTSKPIAIPFTVTILFNIAYPPQAQPFEYDRGPGLAGYSDIPKDRPQPAKIPLHFKLCFLCQFLHIGFFILWSSPGLDHQS
jgi:hypothetical protein